MKHRRLRFEALETRQLLTTLMQPNGAEFPVNTTTENYQDVPVVAVEDDGDFITAWSSRDQDGSQGGVYAQRFQSDGTKLGGEILVNSATDENQGYPDVAIDQASGTFVVTWQNDAQGASDIHARAFHNDGTAVGDQVVISGTSYDHYNPSIASVGDGDFVIAWDSFDSEAGSRIHARHFSTTNEIEGDEFLPSLANKEMNADVASLGDGSFVIAWQSTDTDGTGITARQYDSNSDPVGDPWTVNSVTAGDQTAPAVVVATNGEFVITWLSDATGTTRVAAQRFEAGGTSVGSQLDVSGDISVRLYTPTIAALKDNGVVIAWTDDDGPDVFARQFDPLGIEVGDAFALPSTSDGDQRAPRIASADGTVVAIWTADDDDGDGVFARTFRDQTGPLHPWQNPVFAADVSNNGSIEPLDVLQIINRINLHGSVPLPVPPIAPDVPPPFVDVTGNDHLEPLDALRVINYINKFGSGPIPTDQSEGEAASIAPATIAEGEPLVAYAVTSMDVNPSRWTQEPRIADRASTLRDRAEPTLQLPNPLPGPAPKDQDTANEPVSSQHGTTVETTFREDESLHGEQGGCYLGKTSPNLRARRKEVTIKDSSQGARPLEIPPTVDWE